MFQNLKRVSREVYRLLVGRHRDAQVLLRRELSATRMLTARLLIAHMKTRAVLDSIQEAEFRVFSQFGDDGIIQYLIHHADVRPENESFVEFGVENYLEANTRFLLMNDNWRGLVMDGNADYVTFIRDDELFWRHDLTVRAAFIDAANINSLLSDAGFEGEIGILSIDIDGNDYWVWQAIDVVRPIIVVAEYNAVFGIQHAVTVPYDPKFQRGRAHWSNLYWGASLKALYLLAERKGYVFVGCNGNGNNAYFVRADRLGAMTPVDLNKGFVCSRFRDSRDRNGRLTFIAGADRARLIDDMVVHDVEQNVLVTLRELQGPQVRQAVNSAA